MIPIDELKATVGSPLCDQLAKRSPSIVIAELRRLRYPASDQKLSDWDWLRDAFKIEYLYISGWFNGWRSGVAPTEFFEFHFTGTNPEVTAGQVSGRMAHRACYEDQADEYGGIREGI